MEVELEHDIGAMGFGGVYGDAEEGGDFFVGFAFGEELQDFAFAGSEARTGRLRGVGGGGIVVARGRNARGEVRFVVASGIDGGQEHAVGIIFEDVTASAGLDDLLNEVVGFVHGEDQDFGGGRSGANLASGFDAVEQRHADIEDRYVGFEFAGFVDSIAAVGGFGADFPAGARFQESAETGTYDGMIISDQDAK